MVRGHYPIFPSEINSRDNIAKLKNEFDYQGDMGKQWDKDAFKDAKCAAGAPATFDCDVLYFTIVHSAMNEGNQTYSNLKELGGLLNVSDCGVLRISKYNMDKKQKEVLEMGVGKINGNWRILDFLTDPGKFSIINNRGIFTECFEMLGYLKTGLESYFLENNDFSGLDAQGDMICHHVLAGNQNADTCRGQVKQRVLSACKDYEIKFPTKYTYEITGHANDKTGCGIMITGMESLPEKYSDCTSMIPEPKHGTVKMNEGPEKTVAPAPTEIAGATRPDTSGSFYNGEPIMATGPEYVPDSASDTASMKEAQGGQNAPEISRNQKKALSDNSTDSEPADHIGNIVKGDEAYARNDMDGAISSYSKAIEMNRSLVKAFYRLGEIYLLKGDYDNAIYYMGAYIVYNHYDADAFYGLGRAYFKKAEYKLATENYRKALECDPQYSSATAGIKDAAYELRQRELLQKNDEQNGEMTQAPEPAMATAAELRDDTAGGAPSEQVTLSKPNVIEKSQLPAESQTYLSEKGLKLFDLLLKQCKDINAKDEEGATLLHNAAADCWDDGISMLLKRGADPNSTDSEQNTPLLLSAPRCSDATVRLLVSGGANVNSKNKLGKTPLHLIAESYLFNAASIHYLIQNGADATIKDNEGNTPADIAIKNFSVDKNDAESIFSNK